MAGQMPPEAMEQIPSGPEVPSDAKLKNIRYVLSDAGMKRIKALSSQPKGNLSTSIISACQGGF
jgi:hypothetical protein